MESIVDRIDKNTIKKLIPIQRQIKECEDYKERYFEEWCVMLKYPSFFQRCLVRGEMVDYVDGLIYKEWQYNFYKEELVSLKNLKEEMLKESYEKSINYDELSDAMVQKTKINDQIKMY